MASVCDYNVSLLANWFRSFRLWFRFRFQFSPNFFHRILTSFSSFRFQSMGSADVLRLVDWEAESYPVYEDFAALPFLVAFFPTVRFLLDKFVFEVRLLDVLDPSFGCIPLFRLSFGWKLEFFRVFLLGCLVSFMNDFWDRRVFSLWLILLPFFLGKIWSLGFLDLAD